MASEPTFVVEDAQLLFLNFSGRQTQFNDAGNRNFTIILDPATAEQMAADGWNVRKLAAREEGDEETPIIEVTVGYKFKPPRVIIITSRGKTLVEEDGIGLLDDADIQMVDLICRGYEWEVNGKTGIKAYLQSMYVTINEDPLQRKYGLGVGHALEEGDS